SLLMIMLFSWVAVEAAPIDNIAENGNVVTVSGNFGSEMAYKNITLEVIKPNKDISNIIDISQLSNAELEEKIKDTFVEYTQMLADENGGYSFGFHANSGNGFYTVRVRDENTGAITTQKHYHVTDGDKQEAISGKINKATSKEQLKTLLDLKNPQSEMVLILNLKDNDFNALDEDFINEVLYSEIPFDANDPKKFVTAFHKAVGLANLKAGRIKNILDKKDLFDFDKDFLNTAKTKLSEASIKDITAELAQKDIKSIDTLKKAFYEKIILVSVEKPKSWNDVIYIIETHGEYIGLKIGTGSDYQKIQKETLAVNLGEKKYTNLNDFKEKFDLEVKKLLGNNTPGGSGSGGGGSSGGSNSGGGGNISIQPGDIPSAKLDDIAPREVHFDDLESVVWAQESINVLYEKGIVNGVSDRRFEPNSDVKREEFIKMLALSTGIKEESEAEVPFSDVQLGEWYSEPIKVFQNAGIIAGKPDGSFGLGEAITREEMAVFVYRTFEFLGIEMDISATEIFKDDETIEDFAKDGVYALKNLGIINGVGNDEYAPKNNCTRAESAKIIHSILGILEVQNEK
ncbi:MAG: S-layer homology domain-containing protein, partial [Oscillospiraceae bacterium]